MTVADRSLPTLSTFTQDLKIRHGGNEIAAVPNVGTSHLTEAQAINSLLQHVGPALSQIKAIGDLVSAILALIDAVKAVPDAIREGDPDVLTDALKALGQIADKIAPHIPFVEHAVTVLDTLKVMKSGLAVMQNTLEEVSDAFTTAADKLAEAQSTGNASLEALANELQTRAEGQLEASTISVGLLLKPLEIAAEIVQNIPFSHEIPAIPDLSGVTVIDDLIGIVDQVYNALDAIV